MLNLPLFPLNTVLFPHTPIQLHIFEDRYLRMIGLCLQERRSFGVVLIRRGAEALGPLAEPYEVGCSAEIVGSEMLPGGRLNILALGRERFRIQTLDSRSHAYLSGRVEPYPLQVLAPRLLLERADSLRVGLSRYLMRLAEARGEAGMNARSLPEDPQELACLAAAVLEISPFEKQTLLETETLDALIDALLGIYRREAALVKALAGRVSRDDQPFSLN